MLVYTLLLIFFLIPVTAIAYARLKADRHPLPYFCNNVVVNRIKLRQAIGILSPIVFWALHLCLLIAALGMEAWISTMALLAYMVLSTLLSSQIKRKKVGFIPQVAAPGTDAPPPPPVA